MRFGRQLCLTLDQGLRHCPQSSCARGAFGSLPPDGSFCSPPFPPFASPPQMEISIKFDGRHAPARLCLRRCNLLASPVRALARRTVTTVSLLLGNCLHIITSCLLVVPCTPRAHTRTHVSQHAFLQIPPGRKSQGRPSSSPIFNVPSGSVASIAGLCSACLVHARCA